MQSLLQLYRLHVKCYWQSLKEAWQEGVDLQREPATPVVKEEEKPKSAFHNLNPRGIVVVPIDFDLKSLSEDDQKILLDLISAGRVIGVQDLYCLALIQ
jgi:hypothetical protein